MSSLVCVLVECCAEVNLQDHGRFTVPLSQVPQQVRSDRAPPQVQGVHGLQVLQELLVYQAHPVTGIIRRT